MVYLIVSIVCGSLFSVLFKIYQRHGINVPQTIFFNYVTGSLVVWASVAFEVFVEGGVPATDFQLQPPTLLLTLLTGFMFMMGFMIMDRSTFRCGVALTTSAARSSLVLPVIFSWFFLSQPAPSWIPVAMVLIAMMLIVLPNEQQKHEWVANRSKSDAIRRKKAAWALFGVFIFYGISDFTVKLLQHQATIGIADDATLVSHLLTSLTGMIFVMASMVSFITCIIRGSFKRHPVGWKAIGGGILLGLVNLCCTNCVLRALDSISTGLFYPIYNIGIVILSTIIGICLFKERIKPIQIVGLVIAIAAIALFFS